MADPTRALVGGSPGMVRARASLRALLDDPQPQPVLLIGEPGTGKELAARALHAGARRPGPFRIVEAGGDPGLVELDLFGRRFRDRTGAVHDHPGALEGPGTLLLCDAERLPAEVQVRLFRALARREVQRLGDAAPRPIEVPRVVLACRPGADLAPVVHVLGWRVVPVELPPLRARREDLTALVAHLLRDERSRDGQPLRMKPAAVAAFARYHWPGNVDELARAVRVLVDRHRALAAERAHPVEAVHAVFSAVLDRMFEAVPSVAPAPPAPPPAAAPQPGAPSPPVDEPATAIEYVVAWAEPPVGWGPLPAPPARLRGSRFTSEGLAAAVSAAVTFSALVLGATHLLAP